VKAGDLKSRDYRSYLRQLPDVPRCEEPLTAQNRSGEGSGGELPRRWKQLTLWR
jgi:hypothetical protein